MNLNPINDGVDHINVYSKGKTKLGRLLSNWAETPILLPEGTFETVEGWWFWLMTGEEVFKNLSGWEAKTQGKECKYIRECPTKEELTEVYKAKLEQYPNIKQLLKDNNLPLKYYYVYNSKVVVPKEWQWTIEIWDELKDVK